MSKVEAKASVSRRMHGCVIPFCIDSPTVFPEAIARRAGYIYRISHQSLRAKLFAHISSVIAQIIHNFSIKNHQIWIKGVEYKEASHEDTVASYHVDLISC